MIVCWWCDKWVCYDLMIIKNFVINIIIIKIMFRLFLNYGIVLREFGISYSCNWLNLINE